MSIPAGQANRYVYAGDGSSTSFAVNSDFEAAADLLVYTWDTVGLTASLKVLNSDYTVTGGAGSTGTVVFGAAPANTLKVVIVINPSIAQGQTITTGGVLPPSQYALGLDLLTLISRRLYELFTRSAVMQDYDVQTFDPHLPTSMSANPGAALIINNGGTGFDIGPTASAIAAAQTNATAAAASATAAASSASAASTSATSASGSATAAAASAATAAGYAAGNWSVVSKTANYTTTATDRVVIGDPTSATFTVTLLTAVGNAGLVMIVKHKPTDVSGNVVNVGTTSGQTIDGAAAPYVLTEPGSFVYLISDGANWQIISVG